MLVSSALSFPVLVFNSSLYTFLQSLIVFKFGNFLEKCQTAETTACSAALSLSNHRLLFRGAHIALSFSHSCVRFYDRLNFWIGSCNRSQWYWLWPRSGFLLLSIFKYQYWTALIECLYLGSERNTFCQRKSSEIRDAQKKSIHVHCLPCW